MCGRFNKPSIDAACETNEDDAEHAHKDGDALAHMALECSNGLVVGVDKHCLYHKQIVVKRNNSVNQRNEHQHIQCNRTALQCRAEDEELAREFLEYFCKINSIDVMTLPFLDGALLLQQK